MGKGSRVLPDLQEPLQVYRSGYQFARQNNLIYDAIDALDGMNMILPSQERVQIATALDLLTYNHDAIIQCPKCIQNFELKKDMIKMLPSKPHLPSKIIPPIPTLETFGDRMEHRTQIYKWVSTYHKAVESQISNYRYSKIGTSE